MSEHGPQSTETTKASVNYMFVVSGWITHNNIAKTMGHCMADQCIPLKCTHQCHDACYQQRIDYIYLYLIHLKSSNETTVCYYFCKCHLFLIYGFEILFKYDVICLNNYTLCIFSIN